MKVFIKGLNTCTMRRRELAQYRQFILSAGHTESSLEDCDVALVWGCAFRTDIMKYSLNYIDLLKYHYPNETTLAYHRFKRVIVCGCLVDIYPEIAKQYPDTIFC